jgi:hypothetical protein
LASEEDGTVTDDKLILALRSEVGKREHHPPASLAALKGAEALGLSIEPFLGRVYTEVCDGVVGPGHGALSLVGKVTLVSTYAAFRLGSWPKGLLPVWDWGDAIWSCVDTDGHIVTADDAGPPTLTDYTTRTWLRAWLDGVDLWREIFDDKEATIINPFNGKPVVTKVRGTPKGRPWASH